MSDNNFKVKCIKVNKELTNFRHEGGIYEFKDGYTFWDDGRESARYSGINAFLNNMNDDKTWFVEWKGCTIQDILLTDDFKDGQEFKMELEDATYNVIYYTDSLNHKYLKWKDTNKNLLLTDGYLTAKFYPVIQMKKTYINNIKALELIQQGKEVWCEYDNNLIKFNNPKTKKIQIDHVLNGKFYIMEEDR